MCWNQSSNETEPSTHRMSCRYLLVILCHEASIYRNWHEWLVLIYMYTDIWFVLHVEKEFLADFIVHITSSLRINNLSELITASKHSHCTKYVPQTADNDSTVTNRTGILKQGFCPFFFISYPKLSNLLCTCCAPLSVHLHHMHNPLPELHTLVNSAVI